MRRGHRPAAAWTFTACAAAAGVVMGHWIAYVVTTPAAGSRETFLAQTGHAYWPTAVAVGVVFGFAALAGTVVRHLRIGARTLTAPREPGPGREAGSGSGSGSWERYRSTALGLAGLQASVFVVQEVVERLHAGSPLGGLLHGGFLAAGLAVQVLVAGVLALVLTGLGRAAEAVRRAMSSAAPVHPMIRFRLVLPALQAPIRSAVHGPRSSRAPPELAVRIA